MAFRHIDRDLGPRVRADIPRLNRRGAVRRAIWMILFASFAEIVIDA
jgi:hypothetical protein